MGIFDKLRRNPTTAADVVISRVAPSTWMQAPTLAPGGRVDVVGEATYQSALERIAGGKTPEGGQRKRFTAQLVREPTNKWDRNAVRCDIGGQPVGYLSRDEASAFHAVIDGLTSEGTPATCRASLSGGWDRGGGDTGHFGVVLNVVTPPRRCPPGQPLLPAERKIAVLGEETFQKALTHLTAAGVQRFVAELRPSGEGVAIGIGGFEVGRMNDGWAAQYRDLLDEVFAAGMTATCSALVAPGAKKLEVTIELPKLS
jgi:hypothetical protein